MSRAQWIKREHIRRLIGDDARPIVAVRNSAVLKSWLFLSNGQLHETVYMYSIVKTPPKLKWFTEKFENRRPYL